MFKNATKKQLIEAVESFGGEVDWDTSDEAVYVWAPEGAMWCDSETQCIGVQYCWISAGETSVSQSWKPRAFGELLMRVMDGIEDDLDYDREDV